MHRKHFFPEGKIELLLDDVTEPKGEKEAEVWPGCRELPHIQLDHKNVHNEESVQSKSSLHSQEVALTIREQERKQESTSERLWPCGPYTYAA